MKIHRYFTTFAVAVLFAGHSWAQAASGGSSNSQQASASNSWAFSIVADGYVVPHAEFFVSPTFTADREWLHLEARYNYEDQRTGSMWVGYSFSAGHSLIFEATPMIGGVFGHTTGVAPGYEVSLTYKRLEFSSSGEYVFDTKNYNGSFFYSWPQVTYSPLDWLHVGLAAQRTKAYHTRLDTQRGFLVGFSFKNAQFTTYVFNPAWSDPTAVLELGWSF